MSQGQVIEVLKKNKNKWLTSKDLERALGIRASSISNNLRRLRQGRAVQSRGNINNRGAYEYKYKE